MSAYYLNNLNIPSIQNNAVSKDVFTELEKKFISYQDKQERIMKRYKWRHANRRRR